MSKFHYLTQPAQLVGIRFSQLVELVNECGALIFMILEPKSYMVQAHKLQIDLGQYCGSILGLGFGSLWPTMNPYGFLVVKQTKKKLKRLSWPRECKSINRRCVSHAEGADSRVESGRNKEGSEAEVGFRI